MGAEMCRRDRDPAVEPARWIIYRGKYLKMENVNRKKAELRQIGVSFEPVTNPSMELGLSLGSVTSQQAAQAQLDKLADRDSPLSLPNLSRLLYVTNGIPAIARGEDGEHFFRAAPNAEALYPTEL